MARCGGWQAWYSVRSSRTEHGLQVTGECIEIPPGHAPSLRRPDATPRALGRPNISAPPVVARGDAPPTFLIDPQPHPFYVVEIATDPALFASDRSPERTPQSFFASWADGVMHRQEPHYTIPLDAWNDLREAPRLYYRVGSMSGSTGYQDYRLSILDDEGVAAPCIIVVDDAMPYTNPHTLVLLLTVVLADSANGNGTARYLEVTQTMYDTVVIFPEGLSIPVDTVP